MRPVGAACLGSWSDSLQSRCRLQLHQLKYVKLLQLSLSCCWPAQPAWQDAVPAHSFSICCAALLQRKHQPVCLCRFSEAAASVFGSGWAWLQVDASSFMLTVTTTGSSCNSDLAQLACMVLVRHAALCSCLRQCHFVCMKAAKDEKLQARHLLEWCMPVAASTLASMDGSSLIVYIYGQCFIRCLPVGCMQGVLSCHSASQACTVVIAACAGNQDSGLMTHVEKAPGYPVLGLDVWEHA